jgi:hypothetical protein
VADFTDVIARTTLSPSDDPAATRFNLARLGDQFNKNRPAHVTMTGFPEIGKLDSMAERCKQARSQLTSLHLFAVPESFIYAYLPLFVTTDKSQAIDVLVRPGFISDDKEWQVLVGSKKTDPLSLPDFKYVKKFVDEGDTDFEGQLVIDPFKGSKIGDDGDQISAEMEITIWDKSPGSGGKVKYNNRSAIVFNSGTLKVDPGRSLGIESDIELVTKKLPSRFGTFITKPKLSIKINPKLDVDLQKVIDTKKLAETIRNTVESVVKKSMLKASLEFDFLDHEVEVWGGIGPGGKAFGFEVKIIKW